MPQDDAPKRKGAAFSSEAQLRGAQQLVPAPGPGPAQKKDAAAEQKAPAAGSAPASKQAVAQVGAARGAQPLQRLAAPRARTTIA